MNRKFLLIAFVVNTALFTAANLLDISIWLVVLAEVVLYGLWVVIKTWFDPAQQLGLQGSHMGWTHAGFVRDAAGFRDNLMKRDDLLARISYREKRVYVVEPVPSGPYKDFVEIERVLSLAIAVGSVDTE
jgi:hypothetical protein